MIKVICTKCRNVFKVNSTCSAICPNCGYKHDCGSLEIVKEEESNL